MTIRLSENAKGTLAICAGGVAGAVVAQRAVIAVTTALAGGDIIDMIRLPPGHRPVDLVIDCDDLDSNGAPALTLDVGIMSGEPGSTDPARTCGQEFFAATTVGQAGGTARPTAKTAFRIPPSPIERSIGVKCVTASATFQAGSIGLTAFYAAG